ncbi:MAG: DMT family transporter [Primorskyibacter sp.]
MDPRRAILILFAMGSLWGATPPLYKLAVESGLPVYGLLFWQSALTAILLGGVMALRGGRLHLNRAALERYVVIALLGTVLPGLATYTAVDHLPASIMSILISTVPMMAFPIALGLGTDRFQWRRFGGLLLGLAGVLSLTLPQTALPDPAAAIWIPVVLISALCYASEGNYVAARGTAGLSAVEALFGASLFGAVVVLPVAVVSGDWITPVPPYTLGMGAFGLSTVLHAVTYVTYVWLVGRAGAVFTAQVGYLVTLFGVFWAWVLLGEVLSPVVWGALALILLGVFCVQPRGRDTVASRPRGGHTDTVT